MRLKTRVWIIISAAVLGLVVMGALGLFYMRQGMLQERGAQIVQLLEFADAQAKYFYNLEKTGRLSRNEAQRQAKEAIGAQQKGNDYFFVRSSADNVMLVHPSIDRVGKADNGGKMADGRFLVDVYKEALLANKGGKPLLQVAAPHPGTQDKKMYPKLSGVSEFEPWGWIIGIGFFVDDIEARFWKQSIFFLGVGGFLLIFITWLILRMRSTILQQLGGEPQDAAESMRKIANGDLAVEIVLKKDDSTSLMASLKLMQMKLKNITSAIHENTESLDKQVKIFDAATQSYSQSKSDADFDNLLAVVKKLGKIADILGKSVSRFKS